MAALRAPHPRARARNLFGYHPPIRRITPEPSRLRLPILGTWIISPPSALQTAQSRCIPLPIFDARHTTGDRAGRCADEAEPARW
jgi:hypothetical protein